jgi:hypothetical protein
VGSCVFEQPQSGGFCEPLRVVHSLLQPYWPTLFRIFTSVQNSVPFGWQHLLGCDANRQQIDYCACWWLSSSVMQRQKSCSVDRRSQAW